MIVTLFALSACAGAQSGSSGTGGSASDSDTSTAESETASSADKDAMNESDSASADPNAPYKLDYVDAYGEQHTATIDPTLKLHPYDWDCLTRNGSDLSYTGDSPYTIRKGIDVSHHRGKIDWNAVRKAGIEFVFIRAAYRAYGDTGELFEDKTARTNLAGAAAAGLDIGVFVFSQAVNEKEALEEAALVLDIIKDTDLQLPVVFDAETIREDTARTDRISGAQFTKNALAFCGAVRKAGYEPMVYANMVWEDEMYDMSKLQDLTFWYADYEPKPQTPYDFRFWQYTEHGKVSGVPGEVDLDVEFVRR